MTNPTWRTKEFQTIAFRSRRTRISCQICCIILTSGYQLDIPYKNASSIVDFVTYGLFLTCVATHSSFKHKQVCNNTDANLFHLGSRGELRSSSVFKLIHFKHTISVFIQLIISNLELLKNYVFGCLLIQNYLSKTHDSVRDVMRFHSQSSCMREKVLDEEERQR